MVLAVMAVGVWADPTMTLTLKSGSSKVPGFSGTTFAMEKVDGENNLWKYTVTLPANNADGSYNFSVAGVENETAIVTAGTGYLKIRGTESQTVNIYATIKNFGGTNKVFSSCDGMRVIVGKADYVAMGIIPSSIGNETSSAYFNINAVGSSGKYSFVPLNDIIGTKYVTCDNTYFMGQATASLLYQITTPSGSYSLNSKTDCYGVTVGLYKATVNYKECTVTLEKQDNFRVSLGGTGTATLALPCAITLPEGWSAYTLEYDGDETLNAHNKGNTIAANTPVLINGPAGTYYDFSISAPYTYTTTKYEYQTGKYREYINDVTSDNNHLVGVMQPHYVPENSYVLQNGTSGVGFYKVDVANYAINPFRCYLTLPAASGARALTIVYDDDNTTGVKNVKNTMAEGSNEIYNLSGQRVGKDYKGVVIKNGRKMIQK